MADGIYTTPTLGDAWSDLGLRLADPDGVRWPNAEKTVYIQQALRTYNALTNHFRAEASFDSASPEAFYHLPTILPTLRAQSYSATDAINELCYYLLEPIPVSGVWQGTAQYSLEDVSLAVQQARDAFLLETGIVQTASGLTVDPFPSNGVVDLSEDIINLRRLAWETPNGIVTVLRRTDQWGLTNYRPAWQTSSTAPPKGYSVSTQPPLQVQLAPVSSVAGALALLTVDRGPSAMITTPATSLGVPNDWAWVVIFGALASLLKRDGLALDAPRAAYAAQRWAQGVQQARLAAVVLSARIQGVQCRLGSVTDADTFYPSWPMVPSIPRQVLTAGHTVVALCPPPGVPSGGGNFTTLLQVVRNAPVPVVEADVLQVGAELLDGLLDYAQHLALVKEGAGPLMESKGLLEGFMALCGTTIDIAQASQPNRVAAESQTKDDASALSYRLPAVG